MDNVQKHKKFLIVQLASLENPRKKKILNYKQRTAKYFEREKKGGYRRTVTQNSRRGLKDLGIQVGTGLWPS